MPQLKKICHLISLVCTVITIYIFFYTNVDREISFTFIFVFLVLVCFILDCLNYLSYFFNFDHRLIKPSQRMKCEGPCEGVKWSYGRWSECSATCGGGSQKRQGFCVDSDGKSLPHEKCS